MSYYNLQLWMTNDEGLYNLARGHIRRAPTKDEAARRIFNDLQETGVTTTPDGEKWTLAGVRYAIRGL